MRDYRLKLLLLLLTVLVLGVLAWGVRHGLNRRVPMSDRVDPSVAADEAAVLDRTVRARLEALRSDTDAASPPSDQMVKDRLKALE
jgi:hypothetical protein